MVRVCVTNRKIADGDLINKLESVAQRGIDKIILREKDLMESDYEKLAIEVSEVCEKYSVPLSLHSYSSVAKRLGIKQIHMPLAKIKKWDKEDWDYFDEIGVSIHSKEEAIWAEKAGASYVIAGHIFETDCKKGLEGRGVSFLKEVCDAVSIPVYAIGGIDSNNENICIGAGAKGVCGMSSYMKN